MPEENELGAQLPEEPTPQSADKMGAGALAEDRQQEQFPCWLSREELEQAAALLQLGFDYCGDVDDFASWDYECGTSGSWIFVGSAGEGSLDAECRGALYSKSLEIEPDFDSEGFFERQIEAAKEAIQKVLLEQQARAPQQLSLFDLLEESQAGGGECTSLPEKTASGSADELGLQLPKDTLPGSAGDGAQLPEEATPQSADKMCR